MKAIDLETAIKQVVHDCFHSISQPSMKGKTYGELTKYVEDNLLADARIKAIMLLLDDTQRVIVDDNGHTSTAVWREFSQKLIDSGFTVSLEYKGNNHTTIVAHKVPS